MKKPNILTTVGIAIYVMLSVVEYFLYDLPNDVYLPIVAIGAAFVIAGFVLAKIRR